MNSKPIPYDNEPSENIEITTESVRRRLKNTIEAGLRTQTNTLVSSPTGSGKSYTVATTPWLDYPELTGGEPVIHISPTKKARNDAVEASKKAGVNFAVLKGREDTCSVAAGEHDDHLGEIDGKSPSEWIAHRCEVEHVRFSWAHRHLEEELGPLPCTVDGKCSGQAQWADVPRNNEGKVVYDVVHTTANFAYVPELVENANVFIDEFPDYCPGIDQDHLRRVTTGLLQEYGDSSLSWEGLIGAVQAQDHDILTTYREVLGDVDYEWWKLKGQRVDTLAPKVVRALTLAEPAWRGVFTGWCGRVGVVLDGKNNLRAVVNQPDLSKARCVIGFDAYPSPLRWKLSTGLQLEQERLLTPQEEADWRLRERGLRVVQVGTATRSLTKGWRNKEELEQADSVIQAIHEKHEKEFRTAVCPKKVERDVLESMRAVGISHREVMHYGEEKSRNDFAEERVGLVLGCIDPGDHNILGMLGLLGLSAEPEYYADDGGKGGRKHGRGFSGPDADAAEELLESVRRDSVAQAIGRYARNIDDPDSGALVYVWSDAIPSNLVDAQAPGVVGRVTEAKEEVVTALKTAGRPLTKAEVAEEVGISGGYAYRVLQKLIEQGITTVSRETGTNGADEYKYIAGRLSLTVDLDPLEG